MGGIFGFFGSILGYLLWALYYVFRNYGVAIIFFTIITKAVLFPLSIKQQKSMAAQSKLSAKQKELQEKYGKNKAKYTEELQKLYDKEGASPTSGCLTSLLPLPIMLGIFYSVVYPLSNTLHLSADSIAAASEFVGRLPGLAASGVYPELEVIKNFSAMREYLAPLFSAGDLAKIDMFSQGFNFLGLNLLSSPKGSVFLDFLWVIPVLSLISSFGTQLYMQFKNPNGNAGQGGGCMKVMMYALPLISVYWAYQFPAAVGLYWVLSSVMQFAQTLVTNNFFSVNHMTAKTEAERAVTLELAEQSVKALPASAQKEIADRIAAHSTQQDNKGQGKKKKGKK